MKGHRRRFDIFYNVEIQPLDQFSDKELKECASAAYQAAHDSATRTILEQRHMVGVVKRHGKTTQSRETFEHAREEMREGPMATFMVYHGSCWAGVGTVMPDLPLFEPTSTASGLLPAGLTRRSNILSRPVETEGPNISAWLAAQHFNAETLAATYGLLQKAVQPGERAWTIEPVHSYIGSQAIMGTGMELVGANKRYDDFEAPSEGRPPVSNLYQMRLEP